MSKKYALTILDFYFHLDFSKSYSKILIKSKSIIFMAIYFVVSLRSEIERKFEIKSLLKIFYPICQTHSSLSPSFGGVRGGFLFTIELTPNKELVTSRNWAIRYRFASVKSPVGGTIKPAMEKATATMNDAVAIFACSVLLRVMSYYSDLMVTVTFFASDELPPGVFSPLRALIVAACTAREGTWLN